MLPDTSSCLLPRRLCSDSLHPKRRRGARRIGLFTKPYNLDLPTPQVIQGCLHANTQHIPDVRSLTTSPDDSLPIYPMTWSFTVPPRCESLTPKVAYDLISTTFQTAFFTIPYYTTLYHGYGRAQVTMTVFVLGRSPRLQPQMHLASSITIKGSFITPILYQLVRIVDPQLTGKHINVADLKVCA